MARCVKLFPSPGGLQRSLTTPWLVSSPGKARLSKLLRGIVSVPPPNPSPSFQQEAAGAPSSPNAKAASSSMIVSDGGGAPSAPTSPQANGAARKASPIVSDGDGGAAAAPIRHHFHLSHFSHLFLTSRRPRKPKASWTPPGRFHRIGPLEPRTPQQLALAIKRFEKRRLKWRLCPRSHAHLPKGRGQYFYTNGDDVHGDFCGYIPTPDEIFPSDLHPALRKFEAKYVRERFTKDPDSIAKPGDKFPMSPMQCEHNVVKAVHEQVVTRALLGYYKRNGSRRDGRRRKRPWSAYAKRLICE